MCSKNCCSNATQHAIIFFTILSFLLLPNAFNFNLDASKSSSRNKPQIAKTRGGRDVVGSSASTASSSNYCTAVSNTTTINMVMVFLYGVLLATSIAIVLTSSSYNPKTSTDEPSTPPPPPPYHYHAMIGPSIPVLLGPTINAVEERGGDGSGIGHACLMSLPTFAYSKRRGSRIGKDIGICAICQSDLRDEQMVRWLPDCDHLFHLACIDQWLSSHSTCPCCRAHLHCPFTSIDDGDNFDQYDQHVYSFSFNNG